MSDMPSEAQSGASDMDEKDTLMAELGDLSDFLNFALRSDVSAQRDFARSRGEMMDSIADRINEIAADVFGDVLLEECDDGGYAVMEDYRSMFEI